MNDEELINRVISGDHAAFSCIVDIYKKRMYSFVYKLVQDHNEAEDILQETFIRAYQNIHTLQERSKLLSWLYTIAANYYYGTIRKRKLKVVQDVDLQNMQSDRKEESVETKEMENKMQEAIAKLPKKQKLALILRCFEGLSYQEIASVMDVSLASVKAQVSYARTKLREDLGELYEV